MPAIGAAIASIATTVGTLFSAGGFFTSFVGRLLLSIGLSALQRSLLPKPREPGIKTKVTQTGGTNPQAFPLLKYATAGTHVCPPMSHGRAGDTPNAYLTYVVLLSDIRGCTLSRVIVNSEYVTLAGTTHPDYGSNVLGNLAGYLWVKFYDGSQTVADPMLISKYAAYPERPWVADMIGVDSAYAILTFRYNRSIFPSLPRVRFELNGIPLYDPRKDTTVGGSGAHRWNDRNTWEATVNPVVAAYNVKRGITLRDGSVWGGGFPAEDLPLPSWFAGMNECDLVVSTGSGTEPQFRAGFEVSVDEEPADVIDELMKACMGRVAEIGGVWKVRVGPPGVPVLHITDNDIVITKPQDLRPFPNFAASYNGAHATYPDPQTTWETKEAAPVYNATYEAQDQGQRLIADLNLVAVPFPAQVRRIMYASVEEERRFRRHDHSLPPDCAVLEPLDAISWTSAANGYVTKVFEVDGVTDDLQTLLQGVNLRECDAADYVYPALPAPPPISIAPVIPTLQTVPLFAVTGTSIPDAGGNARRPALSLTWNPDLEDVTGILWEVRVQATAVVVARGSTQDVATGAMLVSDGIIASTAYQVRAKPVVDRPSGWTAWISASTPATLITAPDIAVGAVSTTIDFVKNTFLNSETNTGDVVATLDLGEVLVGPAWQIGVQFEATRAAAGNPAGVVELQSRYRFGGAAFSAWAVERSFSVSIVGYTLFTDFRLLPGRYDDFEYRLFVATQPTAGAWFRNASLVAWRPTR